MPGERQQVDRGLDSAKINPLRASPSGKASAFQADIRRFESGHPLFWPIQRIIKYELK